MIKLLLLSFLSFNAFAQIGKIIDSPLCNLQQPALTKKIALPSEPEYFFKPIPKQSPTDNRDEVSIILAGDDNNGGGNYIMDMNNGALRVIPGPYDGVPTPDGQMIVIPTMEFLDRDTANENSGSILDFGEGEDNLDGVYHSLGVLEKKKDPANATTDIVTYRGITDNETGGGGNNTLYYKDYTFKITDKGEKTYVPNPNDKPKSLCSNYENHFIKTPIISKNGRMLSGYNIETGTSVIFDITTNEAGESICKIKKDLGFTASKMEFSPDGTKVVFAMNSVNSWVDKVDWYSQPGQDDHNMNIFVYDLKSNDLQRISSEDIGSSYYPSFSFDNQVVYLSQEMVKDEDGEYSDAKYYIKRANLDATPSMPWVDFSSVSGCKLNDENALKFMAIGKLWESLCYKLETAMTPQGLGTIPLVVGKENCKKIVSKYWDDTKGIIATQTSPFSKDTGSDDKTNLTKVEGDYYINKFIGFSKDDLLDSCNTLSKVKTANTPVNKAEFPINGKEKEAEDVFSSCVGCHTGVNAGPGGAPAIPFGNDYELREWKDKLLLNVISGIMPKNSQITPEQRQKMVDRIYDLYKED